MAGITVVFGALLIGVGVGGFVATGSSHYTALIPAGLGLLLLVLGGLSFQDRFRKHAMHAAALVGTLGFIACAVMCVPQLPAYFRGDDFPGRASFPYKAVTAVVCLAFVALCVNSFIQARIRQRKAGM
jgi:hypothetical protein